ncbi:BRO family protein [uncultured Microbulbifer sp.]|uniref:BRO-N domain-containing protein n=1 Tax=uncultured Microbulbifer sp. TaxID=348147 RepID=UPI002620948D|nr:BRO family protein [uncultured Microbulbifer sp.]
MPTPTIIPFEFHSHTVRVIDVDGEVQFILSDVTNALGFTRSRDAARVLDADEKGAHTVRTPGGNQKVITVNESGLYHLILKSRKFAAKEFRRWVTSEVLPSIRKTGGYHTTQTTDADKYALLNAMVAQMRLPGNPVVVPYLDLIRLATRCDAMIKLSHKTAGLAECLTQDLQQLKAATGRGLLLEDSA